MINLLPVNNIIQNVSFAILDTTIYNGSQWKQETELYEDNTRSFNKT